MNTPFIFIFIFSHSGPMVSPVVSSICSSSQSSRRASPQNCDSVPCWLRQRVCLSSPLAAVHTDIWHADMPELKTGLMNATRRQKGPDTGWKSWQEGCSTTTGSHMRQHSSTFTGARAGIRALRICSGSALLAKTSRQMWFGWIFFFCPET